MKNEFHPEVPQMLRGFSETLTKVAQPRWASSFDELAVPFESAETGDERSHLAQQGLAYFTRTYGLNDWLLAHKSMPDPELYRILEIHWMLIREVLKRHL